MKEIRKGYRRWLRCALRCTWLRHEWLDVYSNDLKNWEFDEEAHRICCQRRAAVLLDTARAFDKKSEAKPTWSKTNLSSRLGIALCTSFLSYFHSIQALNSDGSDPLIAALSTEQLSAMQNETYTINFNNISMLEFLRFASKMTNLNFIFDEADVQFTVSVISEEPVTAKNVMAALAQVLRIHDLTLLEQDGNVILTKSTKVRQISPIISAEDTMAPPPNVVMVTRVFRIKNANLNTVAGILRPMISDAALIEVSNETKQLIVTDTASNVEQIASLLLSLDAPHSSLDIDIYTVKVVAPDELITLTQQILAPFTEGNPLIFVPQKDTNSIFIVSTPHLIARALIVMEDLDTPAKEVVIGKTVSAKKQVFVYKVQNRTLDDLVAELMNIDAQMKARGAQQPALEHAIQGVEKAENTNSLIFLADSDTIEQLKTILTSLDTPTTTRVTYFIYKIQRAPETQIGDSLNQLKDKLKASSHPDYELIKTIETMQWNAETNSLIFTGSPASIDKLKDILPTFDTSGGTAPKSTFLIYTPQYRSGEELYSYLEQTERNLKASGLANSAFLQTLSTMKWTPSTNSLLFTGDPQSLERVQSMLVSMDTPTPYSSKTTEVFIYKPKYASPEQLQDALKSLIPSLQSTNTYSDQTLVKAIQDMKWNPDTQSFTVTSDPATVERIKTLLGSFDSPQQATSPLTQGFFLYKLQYVKGDVIINELKVVASKIPASSLQNKNLINAINKLEWVRSNNSLVITGSTEAIDQVKSLLADFDVPSGAPTGAEAFFIYKPLYLPSDQILAILNTLSADMQAAGLNDPKLFEAIASARYVQSTNSLVFAGSQETLDKIKNLISTIDVSTAVPTVQTVGSLTFLLYKLQYTPAEQFMAAMKSFANALQKTNADDQEVATAVDSMKYIKENNSVLFTGTQKALQRIEQLAEKFDISTGQPTTTPPPPPPSREVSTFVIYNPKYLTGDELITIMCDFMDNLVESGVTNPALFDTINNLKWIPKTSSLLISGDQASIQQVQGLLDKFDVPSGEGGPSIETFENTSFLVYKLQFHSGVDIQSALKQIATNLAKGTNPNTVLSEAIDSLQWIEPTNSLIATGPQDILVKLKELIQNIDIPLRQVFIEILVLETSSGNIQNFGLQWGGQFQYFNKTVIQTGNFPTTGGNSASFPSIANNLSGINATNTPKGGVIPFSTGFDLGVIGDIIMNKGRSFISLGSLVNALQTDNDSSILINQKIITQDNRQSTIFVGSNIPYTGSIVTNTTNSTLQTNNIEYRDVGLNLTITPILGEGDVVTLDIVEDISNVVGGVANVNTTQVTGITTSHAHFETRVSIPDGKFLALSGVIQDSKTHFRTGIPCLGSLPVIGLLFSENDRTNSRGPNLIMFVRPKIINSFEDYKQITEHQEWLYKDQARLPVLKEEFDEGLDVVKTPEDE
jgi:type III secretion protein C